MQNEDRKPRVSILMAALNCEPFIEAAVRSILQQTYGNWELLVADDGSSDNTRAVVAGFKDPRIKCFHNGEHLGLLHTWNKLMRLASGELLTWQDADDVSHPNRIGLLVAAFEADPDLMLCGSNYRRTYARWKLTHESNFPLEDASIRQAIKARRIPFLGASKMIRREVLIHVPNFRDFYDGLGWEDFDFILRVGELHKVGNLPQVLYDWRYVAGSASRKLDRKKFLKLYMAEVGFFLADQRRDNNGLDGLMLNGPREAFDRLLADIERRFAHDSSALQRRACFNALNNKDFSSALRQAWACIGNSPFAARNYWLPLRVALSYVKTVMHYCLRNCSRSGLASANPPAW